jgi:hypothetical protein
MPLYDGATAPHGFRQKLLPEWQSQPRITPVLFLDHSIVGSASGCYYYFRDSTGIESHFIVCGKPSGSTDGEIWQLMDTDRQADANNEANGYALSCETEDNGDPDDYPWSDAQLDSLIWLHDMSHKYHPTITRTEARDCNGPGLGYHSKMGAPSCWTPAAGKTCPGKPVRVNQWNSILLPAFLSGTVPEEEDLSPDESKWLKAIYDAMVVPGSTEPSYPYESNYNRVKQIVAALNVPGTTSAEHAQNVVFDRLRKIEATVGQLAEAAGLPFTPVDTSPPG